MKREESPFRAEWWWGTSLDNVGLEAQRPDVSTYGCYDAANLPPLTVEFDGSFGWLDTAPAHPENNIGVEQAGQHGTILSKLIESCHAAGVELPQQFVHFMQTPELHARIRSNTGCYLELVKKPIPSPIAEGTLIHFLSDSQWCIHWYLFIPTGSADHAVVCSSYFFMEDPKNDPEFYDLPESDIHFCESSFEEFMCRFWIENELWLSQYDKAPLNDLCRTYLETYRSSPPDVSARKYSIT